MGGGYNSFHIIRVFHFSYKFLSKYVQLGLIAYYDVIQTARHVDTSHITSVTAVYLEL